MSRYSLSTTFVQLIMADVDTVRPCLCRVISIEHGEEKMRRMFSDSLLEHTFVTSCSSVSFVSGAVDTENVEFCENAHCSDSNIRSSIMSLAHSSYSYVTNNSII